MRLKESARNLWKGEGRGLDRIRRASLTGMTSMSAQGITIATGLISVPLTIGYLGKERYGIWLTINSLLQWLYISQLGLSGNALINKLSEANGKDDKILAQELVATAFWSLAAISFIFLLLFAICFPFVNWSSVFNTSQTVSISELQLASAVAFVCFVMMFPTSMVDAVYQSYQEGFIGNIWNIAGSIVSLIALIVVTRMQGGLPLLVGALFGVRLIFSFVNAAYLFFIRHPWLSPTPKATSKNSFKNLMALGCKYLFAQLSGIGMFQSQPMIITQVLGASAVGVFGIAQRLLTLPMLIVQIMSFPLMPAYGEAKARGDWGWIKKTLSRTLITATLISITMVLPLCFLAKTIIYYWAGAEMIPSTGLVWVFGIYTVIACVVTPASVMLYGIERVGVQAIASFINAVLNVILGIFLTRSFGVTGMAVAMTIALALVNPITQYTQVRLAFRDLSKEKE
jgi:O-antigen/teichoic acid export membrane protein